MARILGRMLLILLLILPTTIMLAGNDGSGSVLARAEDNQAEDMADGEDVVDGEEDTDATVETESDEGPGDAAATVDQEEKEEDEDEEKPLKASPDADTHLLFTKPVNMGDFVAGQLVKLLVGFTNKGEKEFFVETMEASFRYPQDYSFFIQNFTAVRYNRVIEPKRQATFEYAFTPSETFNARPFGLSINLHYKDSEGNLFQDAVFNETINMIEIDDGFGGETFFLYVFLAAIVVLLFVGAQQLLTNFGLKRRLVPKSKPPVEVGTQNKSDIDYDWLPKETLTEMKKSPRRSPKQSPKRRRANRSSGSAED